MSVVLVLGVAARVEARGPFVGTFSLRARGTIVRVPLPPGAYDLLVSGTYDYDADRPGDQLADAECSTDSPVWRDPADQAEEIVPSRRVSAWHRHRYVVGAPQGWGASPFPFVGLPFLDPKSNADDLDVAIGATGPFGHIPPLAIVEWESYRARPANRNLEAGAGCDETTHRYETHIVVPPGIATVDFRIHDHHTKDNAGSLTLDIYKVRPRVPIRVAL